MEKLAPFELKDVQGLDKETPVEHGAYGVVFEVSVNGLPCMAKRLHSILVKDTSKEEKTKIKEKFQNECLLLSSLSHPNIVRFIGVCYLSQSKDDLALVMEKLHTDLAAFVSKCPNLSLSLKCSIALDVSYGLLYLHDKDVIHRDLTAPNILISSDLRAKIADLGVSKVLKNSLQITMTTAPGNVNYMAPETKSENPQYGPAMDVFSFGHLLLHLAIQDWPPVYETWDQKALQDGLMEISRRRKALDTMGETHPLHHLATDCLHDDPDKRPPVAIINKTLAELKTTHSKKSFSDILAEVTEKGDLNVAEKTCLKEPLALEVIELQKANEGLEDCVNEQAKLQTLELEKKSLLERLQRSQDQVDNLSSELDDLKEKHEVALTDVRQLYEQVREKTAQVKTYSKQGESFKKQLEETAEQLHKSQQEVQRLRQLVKTVEDDVHFKVEEAKANSEYNRLALQSDLNSARRKIEELEHQLRAMASGGSSGPYCSGALQAEIDKRKALEQQLTMEKSKAEDLFAKCVFQNATIDKLKKLLTQHGISPPLSDLDPKVHILIAPQQGSPPAGPKVNEYINDSVFARDLRGNPLPQISDHDYVNQRMFSDHPHLSRSKSSSHDYVNEAAFTQSKHSRASSTVSHDYQNESVFSQSKPRSSSHNYVNEAVFNQSNPFRGRSTSQDRQQPAPTAIGRVVVVQSASKHPTKRTASERLMQTYPRVSNQPSNISAASQAGPVPVPRRGSGSPLFQRRPRINSDVQENLLLQGIEADIKAVDYDEAPFDPNLICPLCMKQFRVGEIQKYRKHVAGCQGE